MAASIRQTTAADAPKWLDLAKAALGEDHPAKQVYDLAWIAKELAPESGNDTWVAEADGKLQASVTILPPFAKPENPVSNFARNLFRPESYANGAAEALVSHLNTASSSKQLSHDSPLDRYKLVNQLKGTIIVTRVLASDNPQQILLEKLGYVCVGFQPFKHIHRAREGVLFYVRLGRTLDARPPISESLQQIGELATAVLASCKIPTPNLVRDGVTGYPLKTEIGFHEATFDDFDLWRSQAQTANPPKEISGSFNLGFGFLRMGSSQALKAALGQRDNAVVAGISYYYDEQDRCVRVIDGFATDDLSMGAMLQNVVKLAQEQHSAVYVEADILITAPRLIKSAEQLGFVPVAYLPAMFVKDGSFTDVVKMIKLNTSYALENTTLTSHAQTIVKLVDYSFQDQKIGVAIINLLRGLPIFEGLGDGELRKIARLFTQKLYRPGEKVFNKGDGGNEAYIVMRGQIDICLDEKTPPVASVASGQIFGEQAFLDGAARGGLAVAGQPSIILVMQRSGFNDVVQREPHLGMVVMRNIAMDLSNKLRRANTALSSTRK